MKQKHTGIKASSMNAPVASFLLDDYPGAGAAYSVRKLDSDYAGHCMEITRASDSTTQNIGFDGNGDLDTAAINSFCTGTTCYVTTWYDQGPHGYDLTSNSGDWSIYESGNVVTKNGRPTIKNIDTGVNLEASGVNIAHLVGSNAFYGIVVGTYQANAADVGTYYVTTSSAGIYALAHGYNFAPEEVFMYLGFSSGAYGAYAINTGDQEIIEGLKVSSSQDDVYINGLQVDSGNPFSASWAPTGTEDLLIGGGTSSAPCESIQEVILYPSNQSSNRANIYINVAAYYNLEDINPNSLNWGNLTGYFFPINHDSQTISGISTSITLEITFDAGLSLSYIKNGGSATSISNGGTLSVSDGDTLAFRMTNGTENVIYNVTVKNATAGYVTLDTFDAHQLPSGGGPE